MIINKTYRKMFLLAEWAEQNEFKVLASMAMLLVLVFALDILV